METKELELRKVWQERLKLRAEGDKLRAEGSLIWANAVLAVFGNIKIEWKNWDSKKCSYECYLDNGLTFKP